MLGRPQLTPDVSIPYSLASQDWGKQEMEPADPRDLPEDIGQQPDEWDVNDFANRMNSGEFNDNLCEHLLELTVQQLEDLVRVLCGR
jgi:hypothetical protein